MNVTHAFRKASDGKLIRIIREDENGFIGQVYQDGSWHHEFSFGPLSEEQDIAERYGFSSEKELQKSIFCSDHPAYCFYQQGMVFEALETRKRFVVHKTGFNCGVFKVLSRVGDTWVSFDQKDIRFVSTEKHEFRFCF